METTVTEASAHKQKRFDIMNKGYDRWVRSDFVASYYQNSLYMNWGYWNDKTHTPKEACDNMVDTLMGFIPAKKGNILEVACGAGGVTKKLLNYYSPSDVTAINISKFQLQEANKNAPGCNFLLMDATDLRFPDNSFDNIISVEAAFHFDTREKFIKEAYRVLKPGGKLVLSDIMFSRSYPAHIVKRIKKRFSGNHNASSVQNGTAPPKKQPTVQKFDYYNRKNFIDLEECEGLYRDGGFKDIVIQDITKDTFGKYLTGMFKSIPQYADGSIAKSFGSFSYCIGFFLYFKVFIPIDNYILVSVTK